MFPAGYCAGLGVGGWLLMIGAWAALLAVVVWTIARLFPADPRDMPSGDQPLDTGVAVPAQRAGSTHPQGLVGSSEPGGYVGAGRN